jgi:lysophospholipase L1-like esterase
VYFYYENDVSDLAAYLSEAEMRAFIEAPLEAIRYPARMDVSQALRAREEKLARRPWYAGLKRAYVFRAVRWLRWVLRNAQPAPAQAGPAAPSAPARTVAAGDAAAEEARSLGWQYTRKAIAYMQHVSEKHGARLVVVPLAPRTPRHIDIVRQIAADLGLPFLDTSALAADDSLWLPGDGHFSPAGARRMAEMVAERLRLGQ